MSKNKKSKKLEQAISLLGDAWTLRIIASLEKAELRFCQIERAIPTINPGTLTCRLKKLEKYKIIYKKKIKKDNSVTYKLTKKGNSVIPILRQIENFAENFKLEKESHKTT